ncbi:MAG TPA: hypothetical protein DCQ64_04975 [Candidatus Rokubacteria bacterium]|nr:hypothetical protein [Candidatus Rokubacteria bacterium]
MRTRWPLSDLLGLTYPQAHAWLEAIRRLDERQADAQVTAPTGGGAQFWDKAPGYDEAVAHRRRLRRQGRQARR